ncbi:RNA polymerase sigma factor [Paenibacillus sp. P26]|nr:RNA polymerase sigma factor [Paenibacillus sp. P26]
MEIEELIARVREGDPNAFEPVIRRFQQKIYLYCCFLLGDKQEAEDAVQEIFFKAYRGLGSYRHEHSFLAWLYKIASNHCHTLLKRKTRWTLLLPLLRQNDRVRSAEQEFTDREGFRMDWPQGLSPVEKELLVLRVLEDRPFEEIAGILGHSTAALRKRFERLKVKLQRIKNGQEEGYHERGPEFLGVDSQIAGSKNGGN